MNSNSYKAYKQSSLRFKCNNGQKLIYKLMKMQTNNH